ncbi:MAG: abhydrolase domain-containing 18 [Pyrinomonadaceae bacterium]|nr:abhydrolase domain-containing 18 [Pyrinomonadaceae bacterium]
MVSWKAYMHRRERAYYDHDNNRVVRPFEWGLPFVVDHVNGDDPRVVLHQHTENALRDSQEFYALPAITDFKLEGDQLTWTSAVHTAAVENNVARARFFPAKSRNGKLPTRAVVVVPQWNAQPESHVEACRIFNLLGISALRLTVPYHQERRPLELERADHLVSPNVGRTIQSFRQAVLDTRAAVRWLTETGYDRIGVLGTSIGSCISFLAFAHDPKIVAGTFNHVSGYVADVAWHGMSTLHVREGFGNHLTLDELREYWSPISPMPFIPRLPALGRRPMRFISARYDLTFPVKLSHEVIAEVQRYDLPLDVVWLPCGHYTTGEMPWKAIDAWKIATFFRRHL